MIRRQITHKKNKLFNRSGRRTCDICGETAILVEHHISGREIVNANHPSNIANICSNCHMKVHSGVIIVERWSLNTRGRFLAWHSYGSESITGQDSNPYQIGGQNESWKK
jgi:hypothetical protein